MDADSDGYLTEADFRALTTRWITLRGNGDNTRLTAIMMGLTGKEPSAGSYAFRLDLEEAVFTAVEADELVIRVWRPGHGVRTIRRRQPPMTAGPRLEGAESVTEGLQVETQPADGRPGDLALR
jgi:hypothetical protein